MVVYSSPFPAIPIVNHSLFTHLLQKSKDGKLIGDHSADLPVFVDSVTGTVLTREKLRSLCLSLGYGLQHHGMKLGDTILLFSPNALAYPVVLLGAISAGLRCTLANNAYTSHELAHQYTDSRARRIFTTEDSLPVVRAMFEEIGVGADEATARIIVLGKSLKWAGGPDAPRTSSLLHMEDLLRVGSLEEEVKFDGERAHETALLCYSSGTTGKPKGVETTHQNLTSEIDMLAAVWTHGSGNRHLGFLPMYHIYGAVIILFLTQKLGHTSFIQQRFDPLHFCEDIQKYKIQIVMLVPPIAVFLSRHPLVEKYNLSSLKLLTSGAAPLGPELTNQVTARLPSLNVNASVIQGFGMTELSPVTHLLPPADATRKAGSIGLLLPNLQSRIVDEDGRGAQTGEMWIKGPIVMKGYINNPTATANTITEDGWLKTGDIAVRDDEGYFFIVDRVKELIKYKVRSVPPAELESVLLSHSGVADVAVIGIEDAAQATELPRAYVVPTHPEKLRTDTQKVEFGAQIAKWMESKVAKHKYLRGGVVTIDIIPKSAAGKILRRQLRDLAKKEVRSRL
ncbi:AMP binding protein [Guyanagaster necrorhizus]|uniref:AMP binding protein n=1 Tax=Guyanagaster necrorhizus TaxID=856835 RepID=A0A9P7VXA8_9AGAR|nr:AMP binding protein [Guyanagaster necrorhizus MCA 3950]KAG7448155.1 AMP binding protein [Guyanagaster necrorhizus MCA 3950]